jgi:hypothetical protein
MHKYFVHFLIFMVNPSIGNGNSLFPAFCSNTFGVSIRIVTPAKIGVVQTYVPGQDFANIWRIGNMSGSQLLFPFLL